MRLVNVLVLINVFLTISVSSGAPQAEIPRILDLGITESGGIVEYEIGVKNNGDSPLEISRVRCREHDTALKFDHEIMPNQSGAIRLRIDTTKTKGRAYRVIQFSTNDPTLHFAAVPVTFETYESVDRDIEQQSTTNDASETGEVTREVVLEEEPKIQVPRILDLGAVWGGEIVEREIVVENTGQAPLKISRIYCRERDMAFEFDREIMPGQSGRVRLKIDTAFSKRKGERMSERDIDFKKERSFRVIEILTNDPLLSRARILVGLEVEESIRVFTDGQSGSIHVLEPGERVGKIILVAMDPKQAFSITEVHSQSHRYEARSRKLREYEKLKFQEHCQWEITVHLIGRPFPGFTGTSLIVKTDHPFAREFRLSVPTITSSAHLSAYPETIDFLAVILERTEPEASQASSFRVLLAPRLIMIDNRRIDTDLRVTSVSVDDPAFIARLEEVTPGHSYKITVTVDPYGTPGQKKAKMTVLTTDPDYPVLNYQLRAIIEE